MRLLLGLLLTILVASIKQALALEVSGTPRVIDGDTLTIGSTIVRLSGIDAAETGQRCVDANRQIVRPGDLAADKLKQLAAGGIKCAGTEFDDYGRLIAECRTPGGESVNKTLIQEGLAWAFVKYSQQFVPEEAAAKATKKGVWQMACEEPWAFRAKRWEVAQQKSPNGCPIKGNISANGRIYHTPWSRHYIRTKVSPEKGERWFCTEGEAIAAGFRPPIR